jgi:hypothetical protein
MSFEFGVLSIKENLVKRRRKKEKKNLPTTKVLLAKNRLENLQKVG